MRSRPRTQSQEFRVHKIQTPSRPPLLFNRAGGGLSAATLLDSSVRTEDPHPPRGLVCPCSDHRTDGKGRRLPCGGRGSLASSLQEGGWVGHLQDWGDWGSGNGLRPWLTTLGLNGGWISLFSSFSQSILRKKACSRTSRSPSGPQPRRLPGCLVISWKAEERV